jgi:hypothetical protein
MTRLSCLGVNPLLKIHSIFYICKRKYSTFSLKKKFTKTKKIKDIHNPNARKKKKKIKPTPSGGGRGGQENFSQFSLFVKY